jgi:glycosyltransferase involved in cell wall biosynthesis
MKPIVSIIIPTYNRAHLIGQTLDSVLAQTYVKWECIVVDDGSTDYTDELLRFYMEKDARIQYYQRPKNRLKGANACRNYGFEMSKGAFINWFDSDDLMHKDFIKVKVSAFLDDFQIIISKTSICDKNSQLINKEMRTELSKNLLEDFITLKISWYIHDPMYKRSFLMGRELFDEKLLKGQDRDFHIRVLLQHPRVNIIQAFIASYKQTDQSISNDFSEQTLQSLYEAENRRINILCELDLMEDTKLFLLKQQLKKYTYLNKTNGVTLENFKLFKKLSIFNRSGIKWFGKYSLAVVSYTLFGKGYLFLKGD